MDTSVIAGSALLMKSVQTQQALSMSIMKMAADNQKQMANLLEQNVAQMPQPSQTEGITFSTYA